MALTLPQPIAEKLRKEASRRGLTPEEYVLDLLTENLDPEQSSRDYIEAAVSLIEQARKELEKGNLRQASEKIWGACALAIKAYALAKEGRRLESHRELWVYKDRLAKELGSWVRTAFLKADSMHKNFYEGLATREDVEDSLKEVEKLVATIRSRVGEKKQDKA